MSKEENTILLERAKDLSETFTNTTLGKMIDLAIDKKDLETLYYLVKHATVVQYEQDLRNEPIDHFMATDALPNKDPIESIQTLMDRDAPF